MSKVDPQTPSADLLGDLLGPLAIEGPPGTAVPSERNAASEAEGVVNTMDRAAIVPVVEQTNSVQVFFGTCSTKEVFIHMLTNMCC